MNLLIASPLLLNLACPWNKGMSSLWFQDTSIAAKNNVPGDDWVRSFIRRNDILTNCMCLNIKRSRAQVEPEDVKRYFTNLNGSLDHMAGVPEDNIVNYDETNLADEPGAKKCIFRRGVKYPERIINN